MCELTRSSWDHLTQTNETRIVQKNIRVAHSIDTQMLSTTSAKHLKQPILSASIPLLEHFVVSPLLSIDLPLSHWRLVFYWEKRCTEISHIDFAWKARKIKSMHKQASETVMLLTFIFIEALREWPTSILDVWKNRLLRKSRVRWYDHLEKNCWMSVFSPYTYQFWTFRDVLVRE